MKTVYNYLTGGEGQTAGGVTAGTNAMSMNWIICPISGPIAIVKHAMPKIIAPENNPDADGYLYGYRVYHTLEIADNKIPLFRVSYTPIDAPALTATVAAGAAAGTKFTATAGTGNTLAYILGAASPGVKYNDLVANLTGAVSPYTSGADIATAVAGNVLTMMKVSSLGRVIEVKEVTLESGDIYSAG
jgi:hypothetical protein